MYKLSKKPVINKPISQRWILNFVDLFTLILTFFILIYASSNLDNSKWNGINDSLAKRFNTFDEEKISSEVLFSIEHGVSAKKVADINYLYGLIQSRIVKNAEFRNITLSQNDEELQIYYPLVTDADIKNKDLFARFIAENMIDVGNKIKIAANFSFKDKNRSFRELEDTLKFAQQIRNMGYLYEIEVTTSNLLLNTAKKSPKSKKDSFLQIIIEDKPAEELMNYENI